MSLERRPTHERRAEIADAALRLIAARGIAALTMAALAAELGVTGGALFRHFDSREAILAAVAERAAELVEQTFPPADGAPLERIARLIRARLQMVGIHAGIPRLVMSEQFTLALPAEAAGALVGAVERTRAFLVDAVRDGQARGEIRRDVRAEPLAALAMGAMQVLALAHAGLPMGGAKPDPVLDALLTVLAPVVPAPPAARSMPQRRRREREPK
jgi:AcrR family transcriptional regulator